MTDKPDDLLRDLAKDIPWDRPSASRRDAVRSSLLVEAAESVDARVPQRRWPVVGGAFAAGALAAAAIAVLVLRRPPPPLDVTPAQITATTPDTRFEHRVVATETGVDEIVQLHSGKVAISVPPVRQGNHVRLQTRTAEVEGDAGELEVEVVADALQAVTVKSGSARVIVVGQAPVFLSTGQTWRASVITTDLSPQQPVVATRDDKPSDPTPSDPPATPGNAAPAATPDAPQIARTEPSAPTATKPTASGPAASPPVARIEPAPLDKPTSPATPIAPIVTKPSVEVPAEPKPAVIDTKQPDQARVAIEKRFRTGWELLRAGKAREAAVELGAAADAAPDQPLAADARYWQATALIRAGQPRDAERVLVQFLDRAPRSLRRGRAAVLLGRVLAERGDRASATAWFESATHDPDPAVADAARAGLQALQKTR